MLCHKHGRMEPDAQMGVDVGFAIRLAGGYNMRFRASSHMELNLMKVKGILHRDEDKEVVIRFKTCVQEPHRVETGERIAVMTLEDATSAMVLRRDISDASENTNTIRTH